MCLGSFKCGISLNTCITTIFRFVEAKNVNFVKTRFMVKRGWTILLEVGREKNFLDLCYKRYSMEIGGEVGELQQTTVDSLQRRLSEAKA